MAAYDNYNHFDVVIIGAGIAGLTCGALLSKAGRKVAIIEKNDHVGGYCSSLQEGGFTFDLVSILFGCMQGKVHNVLKKLDLDNSIKFSRIRSYLTIYSENGKPVTLSPELNETLRELIDMFPKEKEGIEKLVAVMEEIYTALFISPDRLPTTVELLSSRSIRSYASSTYRKLLDDHISNARLKFLLSAIAASFGGMSADAVSALYMANVIMTFFKEGGFLPTGGMHLFSESLAEAFVSSRGTLMTGKGVEKIRFENSVNTVESILLSDGTSIKTSCVVSNADLIQTLSSLVPEEAVPGEYVRKIKNMKPSPSAFILNLGVDMDLSGIPLSHHVLLTSKDDPDMFAMKIRGMTKGKFDNWIMHIPTLTDATLAPKGTHILSIMSLPDINASADWNQTGTQCAQTMMRQLERLIPGISARVVHRSFLTPCDIERLAGNYNGACYGWAHTPDQFGIKRPLQKTPIEGLFLAGHWTMPGGGVTAAMLSGMMAQRYVEEYLKLKSGVKI